MRLSQGLRAAAAGLDILDPANLPIGQFYQGGYFAGYISHTANSTATHGLIVAPKATGESSSLQWKTTTTTTSGTDSEYDGAANTASMSDANHPAANFCAGLTIGGYSDWYLPAPYEIDIAYFNLKPTTTSNDTNSGENPYSVPERTVEYTAGNPTQTSVSIFQAGGSQAFVTTSDYWTSFQPGATTSYNFLFADGSFDVATKTTSLYVRAFRKFAL